MTFDVVNIYISVCVCVCVCVCGIDKNTHRGGRIGTDVYVVILFYKILCMYMIYMHGYL